MTKSIFAWLEIAENGAREIILGYRSVAGTTVTTECCELLLKTISVVKRTCEIVRADTGLSPQLSFDHYCELVQKLGELSTKASSPFSSYKETRDATFKVVDWIFSPRN